MNRLMLRGVKTFCLWRFPSDRNESFRGTHPCSTYLSWWKIRSFKKMRYTNLLCNNGRISSGSGYGTLQQPLISRCLPQGVGVFLIFFAAILTPNWAQKSAWQNLHSTKVNSPGKICFYLLTLPFHSDTAFSTDLLLRLCIFIFCDR